ncbi:MAG: nucleotide exchange factor GrpE [Methanosarcinales archaeon]|nr:MAG: nucleotide exchange factor GrpE [Methanosarcinales archaeon]
MMRESGEIIVISKNELDEKDALIASLKAKAEKRYKERTQDEEDTIRKKTSGELARQLLNVADTLERAIYSYGEGDVGGAGVGDEVAGGQRCEVVDQMVEGTRSNMEMTYNQLLDASGINPIAPSAGERFNDELHTAIEATQDPLLPDKTILSLVRNGYMLNDELIRPAEVIISRGGGETAKGEEKTGEEKHKKKPGTIISRFLRRFGKGSLEQELMELKEWEQKLEERVRELVQNEETLRSSIKQLDLREKEFGERDEEWTKRKEEAEPAVIELTQRKDALAAEIAESKRQLSAINGTYTELSAKKDKIVIESIALSRYNEELSEEREKLSNELNEIEGKKEALNYELTTMDEKKAWNTEEQSRIERVIAEHDDELSMVEKELQEAKKLVNMESEEIHELIQRREVLASEIKEAERGLELTRENLDELSATKDKVAIESLALSRYNKELLEEREKLLNAPESDRTGAGVETAINQGDNENDSTKEEKSKKSPFTVSTVFWV